jgi:hypothetical protein
MLDFEKNRSSIDSTWLPKFTQLLKGEEGFEPGFDFLKPMFFQVHSPVIGRRMLPCHIKQLLL